MPDSIQAERRSHRRYEAVFILVLGGILILFANIQTNSPTQLTQSVADKIDQQPQVVQPKEITASQVTKQIPDSKASLLESLNQQTDSVSDARALHPKPINLEQLIRWVNLNQYQKAHHYLIEQASTAVDQQNYQLLGDIMHLLARVSATQGDLASAEVYLFEALVIFEQINDRGKLADTHLLIGQMYAKRRQIAKLAGWAYGDLLMARFYLSKGSHYDAKQTLDSSIKDNLKLGRTGAVASGYKTMARYYRSVNDTSGAQQALIEAGKYYAHSGQSNQALDVVKQLRQNQAPLDLIEDLEVQIESRLLKYESQITLVRQASDYMKLYSLYKSKGEEGRAWQFRVKASEILSRTDKRDMYYRAPDVMALLYDSNFNAARAANYYQQAADHYLSENLMPAYQQVEKLQATLN